MFQDEVEIATADLKISGIDKNSKLTFCDA
jgi:hypothetical protein